MNQTMNETIHEKLIRFINGWMFILLMSWIVLFYIIVFYLYNDIKQNKTESRKEKVTEV
jgi:hypothetical protein